MKILQIVPYYNGLNGDFKISPFIENEINSLRSNKNIEIHLFGLKSRSNLFEIVKLIFFLYKNKFDIIHIQTGQAGIFSLFYFSSSKIVVTFGGSELLGYITHSGFLWKLRSNFVVLLSKLIAIRADKIVCVSSNLASRLPNIVQKKIRIIPRGVDESKFYPISFNVALQRSGFIKKSNYLIAFANNRSNSKIKNQRLAEEVIKYVNNKYQINAELLVLKGLTQDELNHHFSVCDALLLTSLHEGSPNIIKEACMCNLPIVSVNVGDVLDILFGISNTFISMTYDAIEIGDFLYHILINGGRSNGREIMVSKGLTNRETAEKIYSVYCK